MSATRLNRAREGRLDWGQVRILYGREMRSAWRERDIVINSVLIPFLLYPLMLWLAFTGLTFVQGQTEGQVSRVLAGEWPDGHPRLARALEGVQSIRWIEPEDPVSADPERAIAEGALDVWIEFPPATGDTAVLAGNFTVRIAFNGSRERSVEARDRIRREIDRYRDEWIERESEAAGLDRAAWQVFSIVTVNAATERQVGRFILGMLLPVFFVMAVAIGCFYPAVDALAGERERGTWETLMSTAATRMSVVTAKYLYVASMGCLAGLLNVLALVATMKPIFGPLLARTGGEVVFAPPLLALPVVALGGVLLSGFVAAGMLLFTVFARTFKEGQSMITPFFLAIVVPVLLVQAPGLTFTPGMAVVPVVNVVLMVRAALTGSFPWLPMALTTLMSLVLIAGCVRLGAMIPRFEAVWVGSPQGGLAGMLRRTFRGRRDAPGSRA